MTSTMTAPTIATSEEIPPEAYDNLCGVGLMAGGANVIMQLSKLPVGYGVACSRVQSGRVDRRPLKRARTTVAFLVIALFGTDVERRALRADINRAHKPVRSDPGDPVQYNAFDPELQLWVAACLIKGAFDVSELLRGPMAAERQEVLYQYAKRLGTTLQVTEEMFPADVAGFWEYFDAGTATLELDDLTRSYLQGIAELSFLVAPLGWLGAPLRPLLRPVGRFMTLGFLPKPYQDALGLPWSERMQRRHERFFRRLGAFLLRCPKPIREFPFNIVLWDSRRRIRKGRSVVGEITVSAGASGGCPHHLG
jgi:uncharacterized protein (DUF2236 family)